MKVELRNNFFNSTFFIFKKFLYSRNRYHIAARLLRTAYLGSDVERHPMRDSVIGLIATFLIIGGDIIGWVAIVVMVFCIHSAVVCARCSKKRNKIGTRKEAVLKTDSLFFRAA